MALHWSIQQLTDYLSEVSGKQDERRATEVAVERAAEALDAEVAAVATPDDVRVSIGFGRDAAPPGFVADALAGAVHTVPGIGPLHLAASRLHRDGAELLVVGRAQEPLSAAELQMLHGMAQMLGLALRGIRTLAAERTLRTEHEAVAAERLDLLDALQERQRLVETLLDIQRTISSRKPLQDILDGITRGASGLFDGWGVCLVLGEAHAEDDLHVIASAHGRRSCDDTAVRLVAALASAAGDVISRAVPGVPGGPSSLLLATPVRVEGDVAGSLVADLPLALGADLHRQELLSAFAQQVSLALTDARTMAAVREAFHDQLTGLANRALFVDLLGRAFAAAVAGDARLAVVYIDLDGFKAVNDTCGHQAGDQLLALVAQRIRACLREGDTAARLGGDEFAVLLGGADEAVGVEVAERIIAALREPFEVADREVFIGGSAGVAERRGTCPDGAELLGSADTAMYLAKQSGRGRVVVFEPAMRSTFRRRLGLQGDLRAARGYGQFKLAYQPIVELSTQEVVGLEALVRWEHPEQGLIMPAQFIPIAEETGVIRELGRWVLERGAERVAEWRRAVPDLRLSVNVSARQLVRQFPEDVAAVLARTGLPGRALTLELTETALMADPESALVQLDELRELGVLISMDDFGTGYSALSYLRSFPVDEVKIDRSFVADVNRGADDLALVRAVIDLGQALRLRTVAEGIEDAEQLATLRGLGCSYGQGHLLSRPLEENAVAGWLADLAGDGERDLRDPSGRLARVVVPRTGHGRRSARRPAS